MSRKSIVERRKKIEAEIKKIKGRLQVAQAKLTALRTECDHPAMKQYYSMAEPEMVCPDCGLGC